MGNEAAGFTELYEVCRGNGERLVALAALLADLGQQDKAEECLAAAYEAFDGSEAPKSIRR